MFKYTVYKDVTSVYRFSTDVVLFPLRCLAGSVSQQETEMYSGAKESSLSCLWDTIVQLSIALLN